MYMFRFPFNFGKVLEICWWFRGSLFQFITEVKKALKDILYCNSGDKPYKVYTILG